MSIIDACIADVHRRYPRIVWDRPQLQDLPSGTILGGATWSRPGVVRYVINPAMCVVAGEPATHIDLARYWIRAHYRLPLRRRRVEDELTWAPQVLWATPTAYHALAYVDLVSTYRRVIDLVGWDAEYWRGRYLSVAGAELGDLAELSKLAYSAAVAIAARPWSTLRVWDGQRLTSRRVRNVYSNTSLYRLMRDALWGIASDVRDALGDQVVYANTDGYIVPSVLADEVVGIARAWGFAARVKLSGEGEVRGVASWRIAASATRRDSLRPRLPPPLMPLEERAWLRPRLAEAAARRAA
jgi:hypothetical protein